MSAANITDVEFRETTQDPNHPAESKTTSVSLLVNADSHQELAANIKAELALAKAGAESTVAAAIRVGELLLVAKEKVPHGQFQQWLTDNCHISIRHAQRYLSLAKKSKTVEPGDTALACAPSMTSAIRALNFNEADNPNKRTIYVQNREPHEKLVKSFKVAWTGLKKFEKDFSLSRKMDCAQIRKKLLSAVELIDALEATK